MMNSFYIGWTSDAYRTDLLPEPEAPSNYKDPAKIVAAVAAKKEKQEADARFSPFYGKLSSICMLSPAGDVLLQHNDGEQDMDTGTMFTDFLINMFKFPDHTGPFELTWPQLLYNDEPAQLVGKAVKDALKMAAMEALAVGTLSPNDIPPRLWYGRSAFCVDPYEVLSSGVPGFDPIRLDTFFKFSFEATDYVEQDNGVPSTHYDALRAKHVAEASGLVRSLVTA
jgi:hypothetical protein